MKSLDLLQILIGLAIGSFATYEFTRASKTPPQVENAVSQKTFGAEPEVKAKSHSAQSPQPKGNIVTSNKVENSFTQSESMTVSSGSGATSSATKSQSETKQACLNTLKPSEVEEWKNNWHKRVNDFISNNDDFWDSRGRRSFDGRVLSSIRGKYSGNWKGMSNPKVTASFTLEIETDTKGRMYLDIEQHGNTAEEMKTSSCTRDLIPRKDLGVDEKESAVNVFVSNCNPELLGTGITQFAFKLPTEFSKGQRKSVEVYGLNEDFEWKSSGAFDLQKL